jgi:HEAT repeat protein
VQSDKTDVTIAETQYSGEASNESRMLSSAMASITKFATDPFRCSRQLRDLLAIDKIQFRDAVIQVLGEQSFTQGHQFALALLISEGLVFDRLFDPKAMSRTEAGRLIRRIDAIDGTLVVSVALDLLRGLAPHNIPNTPVTMLLALELLEHAAASQRAAPILVQLLRHSDERIRSKATLVLGQLNQNLKWAEERMNDTDPRVRANAIESMWGLKSLAASRIFESAVEDSYCRVAANAAIGLYLAGDVSAPGLIIRWASGENPIRRASAAWAMGQTGDPRFVFELSSHALDPDAKVRKNVFNSLAKIRLRVDHLTKTHPLEVVVSNVYTGGLVRHLEIAVLNTDAQPVVNTLPLNFIVSDAGKIQHCLTVKEGHLPKSRSLAFAVPAAGGLQRQLDTTITSAFKNFLRFKRKADDWNVLRYSAAASEESGTPGQDAVTPDQTPAFSIFGQRVGGPDASSANEAPSMVSNQPINQLSNQPVHLPWKTEPSASNTLSADPNQLDGPPNPEPRQLRFLVGANAALAVSEAAILSSPVADNLHDALASLVGTLTFSPGSRQIVIMAEGSILLDDASGLAKNAKAARIQISALLIGAGRNVSIGDLCRETGGTSIYVPSPEELPAASRRLATRITSFYKVEYESSSPTALDLSVQVHSEQGFGKDELSEQLFNGRT